MYLVGDAAGGTSADGRPAKPPLGLFLTEPARGFGEYAVLPLAAPATDDQGHGEAAALLATTTAAANGNWTAALSPGQLSSGASVTATATAPASFQTAAESSEFSLNVTAS